MRRRWFLSVRQRRQKEAEPLYDRRKDSEGNAGKDPSDPQRGGGTLAGGIQDQRKV